MVPLRLALHARQLVPSDELPQGALA
jgi:hypothetical protein